MTNLIQLIVLIFAGSTLVFGTIAIWILMGYYSVRLFRSFKGGAMSSGWKYICIAVPFLILGQLLTSSGSSSTLTAVQDGILRSTGVAFSLIGGIMIVVGFRAQFRLWNPKGMKSMSARQVVTKQAVEETA
jgi:hypothetical protein